jgi:OOP family OmpA-OmpF porin
VVTILSCIPIPAAAIEAGFPATATQTASVTEALGSYALPIGPWADGSMLTQRVEGRVVRNAWRIASPGATTLELLSPLRAGIEAEGFRLLYDCVTRDCGGFDFRYGMDVLPEPDMHVDLGDFRYLAAVRGEGAAAEHVALLVSRSAAAGFVQVVRVGPATAEPHVTASTKAVYSPASGAEEEPAADPAPGASALEAAIEAGTLVLEDLDWDHGASTLAPGDYASLAGLAAYLADNPGRRIAIVGHTDTAGSLAGNIALSRRRAEAVRDRLIRDHGAPAGRITAEGVGYLVPRASNQTEDGRARNRRVEVMLAGTD